MQTYVCLCVYNKKTHFYFMCTLQYALAFIYRVCNSSSYLYFEILKESCYQLFAIGNSNPRLLFAPNKACGTFVDKFCM